MVEFKIVLGDPKTGKSVQKTITEQDAKKFIGKKIGDSIKGEEIGAVGYEFIITGGSDYCGFPMRKGINGDRKKILAISSVGIKKGRKGMKQRKNVCGDTINNKITQINLKITKYGKKPLDEAPANEGDESGEEGSDKKEVSEGKDSKKPEEKPKAEDKDKKEDKS